MTGTLQMPTRSDVERAVCCAVRAPSIHHTQPWRRPYGHGVPELYAGWTRHRGLTAVRTVEDRSR